MSADHLFAVEGGAAAAPVTTTEARRSVDDLIDEAWQYRSGPDFRELVEFVGRFRLQKPFNALLLHIQRPGATYVETARAWRERYGRVIKPGERPLVVLWTFGPVMFVYDVAQTEPDPGAPMLPSGVEAPFAMPPIQGVDAALRLTIDNAKLDGVRLTRVAAGAMSAGCIRPSAGGSQAADVRRRPPRTEQLPVRYEVECNDSFDPTETYTTLTHELGHLYCGHLGTPNPKWWPDRSRLAHVVVEFEAEAVSAIACKRLDPQAQLPPYLAHLLDSRVVPEGVSLDRIMTAAGRVVEMAVKRVPPRKDEPRE